MPPKSASRLPLLLNRSLRWLQQLAGRRSSQGLLDGLIAGTALQVVLAQLLTLLGASDALVIASVVLCCAGTMLAVTLRTWLARSANANGLAWMLFAGWLAVSPLLLTLAGQIVARNALDQLAGMSLPGLVLTLGPAIAICLIPAAVLTVLLPVAGGGGWFATGIALSWLAAPVYLGTFESLGILTLALGVAASVRGAWLLGRSWLAPTSKVVSTSESSLSPVVAWFALLLAGAALVTTGGGLALATHIARQLVAGQLSSHLASWSGGLVGGAIGFWLIHRSRAPGRMFATVCCLGTAGVLGLTCGYTWWAGTSLWVTAWVGDIRLIYLCRGLMLGSLWFPLGLVAGSAGRLMAGSARGAAVAIACLLCGWLWSYISSVSPVLLGLSTAAMLLLVAGIQWWATREPKDTATSVEGSARRFSDRLALPLTACLLIVAGVATWGNYRPDLSEKYLFAGGTFAAYREGTPVKELPFLDDGRLLSQQETVRGRTSVWKHRGLQFAVRQDGMAVGWASGAPQLSPDNLPEIAAVLLPLVTHATPERVLVLGNEGTAGVFTALSFPVRQVTCVSATPQMQKALDEVAANSTLRPLWSDDRLQQYCLDPALAGLSAPGSELYDVVVSQPSQSMLLKNTAMYTEEFYNGVRGKLAPEGVFCQRLNYYDFGPDAVRRVVSTFHRAFPNVLLTEAAPGELLLLGSDREGSLFSVTTVSDLKRQHTREVLGRVGWDWSMVANLGGLNTTGCEKFINGQKPIRATGASIAFSFPREVARWDDKWAASRQALARHGEMLANWLGDVVEKDEIRQRLEDVKASRDVVTEHPDQFWAYRAVLKNQLQKRPRTDIVQTSGGTLKYGLHPEDERRKDYLETLGEAAGKKSPGAKEIQRLNDFIAPYDPLISYFLHQEAAYMFERSESREPGAQLAHWLHAIYFAAGHDRSVRHICSAIKLLHDDPQSVADEAARFDHLNGLLEMLRYRWSLRYQANGVSKFEPIDTEQSLAMAQQALEDMQALCEAAGVPKEEWRVRRDVLEEQLLHPLRAHRSTQARQVAVTPSEPERP